MQSNDSSWLRQVQVTWNERAGAWDQMSEANAGSADRTTELNRLVESLQLHPGSRLLDAGCGAGQFAIAFAQRGCIVTGVDLASAMVGRARVNAARAGAEIEFRTGDIANLADPADWYDAIFARVVLQFAPDVMGVMEEFRRVLRPGGRLFASVPGSLSPIYSASWRRHTEPGTNAVNFMVPWELEELLAHYGWTIIDQWGDRSQSLSGEQNAFRQIDSAQAERRVLQALSTTWGFVAE